jgi:hypothetical protein
MSLDVIADGRGGFRLDREGQQVGWVEGRTVGFQGFESAAEARHAASAAYDALRAWVARQRRTELMPGSRRALRAQRDGVATWLTLGGIPIGRIVEPHERDPLGARGYGFELDLPPPLQPVIGISAAQVIDAALVRRAAATHLEAATVA